MVSILLVEQRLEDTAWDRVLPDCIDVTLLWQRPLVLEADETVVERMRIVGPDGDTVDLQIWMKVLKGFAAGGCDD